MKQCRCVLCGEMILAETQEDCVAHMQVCEAFCRVHPPSSEGGGGGVKTNPNGIYPPQEEEVAAPPAATAAAAAAVPAPGDENDKSSSARARARAQEEEEEIWNDKNTAVLEEVDDDQMSVREMKELISNSGLTYSDCLEKKDLRNRAREALFIKQQKEK